MFGKFMNNYYYGKSGKGDYNPEDLPKTRWQLFMEMLRIRLSALCRLNLIYVLPWLPAMLVIASLVVNCVQTLNMPYTASQTYKAIVAAQESGQGMNEDGSVTIVTDEEKGETQTYDATTVQQFAELTALSEGDMAMMQLSLMEQTLLRSLLLLIPCLFITGPWTAGMAYVTRNWARDEHAFIWSDFKDAMKLNWKPALGLSAITSLMPILVYLCWTFYSDLSADNWIMVVPQMLTLMVGLTWSLAVTYAYPMLVTYKMSFGTIIRNSLLLAIGRLPMSVGVRLLHCVPIILAAALTLLISSLYVPLILFAYYMLFGFSLSRFITASYTNAAFDRFINSRIEGAEVNRGLAEDDDDDDWEDEEEEEREIKPWENGYTADK